MRTRSVASAVLLLWLPTATSFTCDNGKILPDSHVADDYCDCADGSDEAGRTGACPNTMFRCESRPHKATFIFASRVNDGICDCCDGTDETTSGATCENTCVELAKTELRMSSRAGIIRVEREVSGKEAAVTRKAMLAEAREALASGAAELERAQTVKADAEAAEARRREDRERRLAAGEVEAALKMAQLSAEQLRVVLARLALAKTVEGCDALHDKLSAVPALAEAMEDVDSADLIEVAMESKEAEADGAEGAPSSCAEAAEACGFEPALMKLLPLDAMPPSGEGGLAQLVKAFAEDSGQMPFLIKVCASLLRGSGVAMDDAAVAAALALLEPFHDEAASAARATLEALETKRKEHAATISELEPVAALEGAFGESHEWAALYGQCYTAQQGVFEYRLCPYDAFTQDGRSLGGYKGWSDAGSEGGGRTMVFDGGEECEGTPRKASVTFECGEEDKLLETTEPSTCVYSARFSTPSACSTVSVREQHAALAAAAKEAGLPYEPDEAVRKLLAL